MTELKELRAFIIGRGYTEGRLVHDITGRTDIIPNSNIEIKSKGDDIYVHIGDVLVYSTGTGFQPVSDAYSLSCTPGHIKISKNNHGLTMDETEEIMKKLELNI